MLFEIGYLRVGEVKAPKRFPPLRWSGGNLVSVEYDNLYIYSNLYNKTI